MSEKSSDFIVVLNFLFRWKYPLLIISFLAAVAGAIFSGPAFITPKYESVVIFYPSTAMSASKALVAEKSYSDEDFLTIGTDEEAEQLLQILQSDGVVEKLKNRFNLMDHYNIKPTTRYANTKFKQKFSKNFNSELTKYMSIRVSVLDKDPKLAAKMANDAVAIMDSLRNNILKARAKQGLIIVKKDYNEKVDYLRSIVDSLRSLSNLGVMKFEQQTEVLTKAYTDALLKGNMKAAKDVQKQISQIMKYGPIQEALAAELEFETEELVNIRARYKEIKIDESSFIPNIFYVEHAVVAEKKSYPVRWLITVLSAIFTFTLLVVAFILYENLRNVKLTDKD